MLYISPRLPPAGGIATLMETLVRNGLPGDFRMEVVNTAARGRKMHANSALTLAEVGRNAGILFALAKALVHFRPDIVHLNCSVARTGIFRDLICASFARFAGARMVTHYHGSVTRFVEDQGLPVTALHGVIARSGANIASSDRDLAYIRRSGRARGGTFWLPNYVDADRFPDLPPAPRPPSARLRGIYVGALTQPKGALDIVEVARRRPGIDFTLVTASVVDSFLPWMDRLPANVTVRVNLSDADLRDAMSDSAFFIFLSYHEGFPLAVTEAMCCGLPVVATRAGAVPEMIDEGAGGFLCDAGDIEGALAALDRLVVSGRLTEMGDYNNRKARAQYAFDVVADRLVEVYRLLLHPGAQVRAADG